MFQPFHRLRRADQPAGAAAHRIARLAHRVRATVGAGLGKGEGQGGRRAPGQIDRGNFRDHVTRAVNLHPVTHPDIRTAPDRFTLAVAPGDVILVVQRRVRNDDAPHGDRAQPRHRRQRAGAADLDVDRQQPGPGQLGGKLVRQSPARGGGAKPEAALQRQIVDLVNHAVDIVAKAGALRLDPAVVCQQRVWPGAEHGQRVDLKAKRAQAVHRADLGSGQGCRDLPPGIGEKAQRPGGGDVGIKLAQRPGGGIARVGKGFFAGGRLPRIQRGKIGVAHVNLAAHFQHLGRADKVPRNVGDGAGVGGDILADLAVAARRRLHQIAALVAQAQRQPVDLGLGGEVQHTVVAQILADALKEIDHIAILERILEAEHRNRVAQLGKALGQRAANLAGRAVGHREVGKPRLEGDQAALERVIVGIRDLRRVVAVIGDIGSFDGARQLVPFGHHLGAGQPFNRLAVLHRPIPGCRRSGLRDRSRQVQCVQRRVGFQAPIASRRSSSAGAGSRST